MTIQPNIHIFRYIPFDLKINPTILSQLECCECSWISALRILENFMIITMTNK